jgi:predicted nucleic acid-binding protein
MARKQGRRRRLGAARYNEQTAVKWFVDTSVLVPVFIPGHVHHDRSFRLFAQADRRSAACAAHSLAEVYATVTRLPGRHRASGQQALTFLEMIEERFSFVTLDVAEYRGTIREAAVLGIMGGTLYDALVGACARKAKAEILYTWNVRHFEMLGIEVARRLRTP